MANYFNLTLDTTGPASPSIVLASGETYATNQLVNAGMSTSDGDTTGYQMKIWGDVDTTYDTNVQGTETNSTWITFQSTKQIKLGNGDGSKTVYCKIRDDVYNESSQVSDGIILNTTLPAVTITGPDVSKVSKISGKSVCSFSFQVDSAFVEYKVKVVPASGSAQDAGTVIGTTNGSTNMAGTVGNYAASTPINCSINGTDLETASSGDGAKIIKVFAKNAAGLWSV
jgi:hypothetical protein